MRSGNISVINIVIVIAVCLLTPLTVSAQQETNISQYYEVPSIYNPSAIGQTDFIRIRGGARLQWVGIDNAPQSFMATADMPFKLAGKRLGVGINMRQASMGLYKSLDLGAQIAYKLRKLGGEWSFGIQLGFGDQAFKGSEVYIPDNDDYHQGTDDAIPTTDVHGTAFDFGAGVWYTHKYFYAGVSCTHLSAPTITLNTASESGGSETSGDRKYEFKLDRTLYFIAGCNIPVKNTLFEIMPSVLVKSTFNFTTAEINARARYRKFLSFGIGYRFDDAVVATLAAEIKNFYIGYSFDYATSALHSASSGSHELFVGYSLKLDLGEKNKNRHKSVRIL